MFQMLHGADTAQHSGFAWAKNAECRRANLAQFTISGKKFLSPIALYCLRLSYALSRRFSAPAAFRPCVAAFHHVRNRRYAMRYSRHIVLPALLLPDVPAVRAAGQQNTRGSTTPPPGRCRKTLQQPSMKTVPSSSPGAANARAIHQESIVRVPLTAVLHGVKISARPVPPTRGTKTGPGLAIGGYGEIFLNRADARRRRARSIRSARANRMTTCARRTSAAYYRRYMRRLPSGGGLRYRPPYTIARRGTMIDPAPACMAQHIMVW